MGLLSALGNLAGGAAAPLGEWARARELRKIRALELDLARHQGEIAAAREGRQLSHTWELESIRNSGWKDEYWTVVLSVPMVGCFIPGGAKYVHAGFAALDQCPNEYWWLLGAAVASAYGVRPMLKWFRGSRR